MPAIHYIKLFSFRLLYVFIRSMLNVYRIEYSISHAIVKCFMLFSPSICFNTILIQFNFFSCVVDMCSYFLFSKGHCYILFSLFIVKWYTTGGIKEKKFEKILHYDNLLNSSRKSWMMNMNVFRVSKNGHFIFVGLVWAEMNHWEY